jgi:Flp pilus assembly pilin Flp
MTMQSLIQFLWMDDAATAVEYAVMLSLILTAVIASIAVLGGENGALWGKNSTELQSALAP